MNKDLKNIIILGLVSVIISSIALYSFRDIKFKNTKKLQENTIEEIQQEYEALLDDPNDIFQEEINQKTTGELNIMLPGFFMNQKFDNISQNLSGQDIFTKFHTTTNLSTYKNIINSGLNDYDIYLLPSIRINKLDLANINIGENPKPYFHQIFQNIINIQNNKFIPYSIDPLITLKKEGINIGNSWESLFSYTTLRKQNKPYSMPTIWGIGKNDLRLIERGSGPFQGYEILLDQHIRQIQENKNLKELKNMINTKTINLDYKYNFANFKKLYETIQKRDNNCQDFPAICLMSYNFGDLKFGLLSDLNILQKHFSGNQNNFYIDNFYNVQSSYPTIGRVFVVPQNNENIYLANQFFKEYLSQAIQNNTGLRNNTLSAVNNIYDLQKNQKIYQKIIPNENNFTLIQRGLDYKINENTLEMLRGNYNPEIYINGSK
ncbi:MAG TPA: hypothetical protein P5060_03430 [Candidatus Absconditabacterales bacterium]|nr:hypothetical protein [Candidatus Absconditabacterales bacterium]